MGKRTKLLEPGQSRAGVDRLRRERDAFAQVSGHPGQVQWRCRVQQNDIAGRASLDEVNEALEWELPRGEYETVAGLVLATLHRIPLVGEVFRVGRFTITVLEADNRRVLAVRITPDVPRQVESTERT